MQYLRSLGLRVRLMPHTGAARGGAHVSAEERADDIHAAFADPDVSVILTAIGGDASVDLLPHLDYDLIKAHPKVFQGYSDVTVLHWAMLKFANLGTIHGPALISELGEHPAVLPYTDASLRASWFQHEPLEYRPADSWTDEFLDWTQQLDLARPRVLTKSDGWRSLRPGCAEGPLLGGCLDTICRHLVASPAWLDLSGSVLLLETSEERPNPALVDDYLALLKTQPGFTQIAGLVVARPYGYSEEDRDALWRIVLKHTDRLNIPALVDVDAGHTDPMLALPLGGRVRLDADSRLLEVLDPITEPPS